MYEAYKDMSVKTDRYVQTMRPKATHMRVQPLQEQNENILYMPVIRYEGLYYNNDENQYLGKFYFYEPESEYYINLGNTLLSANKYHAIRFFEYLQLGDFDEIYLLRNGIIPKLLSLSYLYIQANTKYSIVYHEPLDDNKLEADKISLQDDNSEFSSLMRRLLNSPLRDDLLYALSETKKELIRVFNTEEELSEPTFKIKMMVHYDAAGRNPQLHPDSTFSEEYNGNIFSKADYLDQPLVYFASKFGYDSIILQREVGEYNIVSEVLDCRHDAGNHIYKLGSNSPKNYKYPYIWTQSKHIHFFNKVNG